MYQLVSHGTDERDRWCRWLHDTVLQDLELIATAGYGQYSDTDRLREVAIAAADRLRQSIECGEIGGAQVELASGLQELVEEARAGGLEAELVLGGDRSEVCADVSTSIVNAAREALHNVVKHAAATRVWVTCTISEDVVVTVYDDGRGMAPDARAGFGIRRSIVDRIRDCGGTTDFDSEPGRGTVVRMIAPRMGHSTEGAGVAS